MYGSNSLGDSMKVEDLLTKLEIERIIPKEVSESLFDFSKPYLDVSSVQEMKDQFEIEQITDPTQFNSAIFVKIALQTLDNLDTAGFSIADKKKYEELMFLLKRIGNVKVNEGKMFKKLIETTF